MSNEDQNSETTGTEWVEDVVNRALKSSYGSDEELLTKKAEDETNEVKQNLVAPIETYEHYPYPDEDESVNLSETPQVVEAESSEK